MILHVLYWGEKLSIIQIMKKFGIRSERSMELLFKFFGIERRSLQDVSENFLSSGACIQHPISGACYQFKHGWHVSWNNSRYYFRSSYELDYMKILDEKRIVYLSKPFRIPYFDTIKQKGRYAIPDMFLPESNTLVEIKLHL